METGGSFISYEKPLPYWQCDDGSPMPARIYFKNCSYDEETRTFKGLTDWREKPLGGESMREYQMVFSEDFGRIESGFIQGKTLNNQILNTLPFGTVMQLDLKKKVFIMED